MTEHLLLGLLAETSIHPGAGRSVGVVDLPVAREAANDYPVLVGSSLKGALKQWAKTNDLNGETTKIFGAQENAGALLVSDARLLLLPVRSLHSAYKWVTCPHLLERFQRDARRAGIEVVFDRPAVEPGKALAEGKDDLFLEERQFQISGKPGEDRVKTLQNLIPHESARSRLAAQLVILHDDDFTWFARFGLSVNARNRLDNNKTSEGLWYEESLPPDCLFYTILSDRDSNSEAVKTLAPEVRKNPYVQAGGNETVGMGWFAMQAAQAKGGAQ
ncbi:MAG: type III-B CRISPR module RAMP protein Cmr4 [Opitutales bacterium]